MDQVTFSKSVALELLDLNSAAYALAETGHCTLPDGFSPPVAIRMPPGNRPFFLQGDPLDIWGFATVKFSTLYLIFRGTQITSGLEFAQEWAEDALSLPIKPFGAGSVHLGFYGAWMALMESAVSAAIEACAPGVTVKGETEFPSQIISGHSLGAAIATLCWSDFGGELMTFASPRVGNPSFAAALWAGNTVRVVNAPDIVPSVPPDPPFRQGGQEVKVYGPGSAMEAHTLASYQAGIEALP
jgi:hypothetical protein